MLITPVHIKKDIRMTTFTPVFGQIPVRRSDASPILEQLNLNDFKDKVFAFSASIPALCKVGIHKDSQYPVKWSLLLAPVDNDNVLIEIVRPKSNVIQTEVLTPVGTTSPSYRDEDCDVAESWCLKYGSCFFNPSDVWHRAVNLVNRPQIIFSLRSTEIEIDEVLKRIT